MTTVEMTAGIIDGSRYDTVRYPGDEILLRVTEGGNVQVVEYFSTDRDGPRALSPLARGGGGDRRRGGVLPLTGTACASKAMTPIDRKG